MTDDAPPQMSRLAQLRAAVGAAGRTAYRYGRGLP